MRSQPSTARPTPWALPPDGFHYEVYNPVEWVTPPRGAGRCRHMVGRKACGAKPVASIMRNTACKYGGYRLQPWDYCADHLYGGWIEDGKVTRWKLVRDGSNQ